MKAVNTLQNLCLDKIINNFVWYYEMFAEDSCLELFEFLKKKFSLHIMQKLNEKYQLKPEYLNFLINKYLKVLDTRWLKKWPWETISQKLAEIGPNLEEIIFCDRPWKKLLCYLPNLKSVFFQHHCTDEFLIQLSKFCGSVETLNVKYSRRVSDSGLKKLCCLPDNKSSFSHVSIKELLILGTQVGNEGVACILKNMPNLQKIDYCKLPEVLYSMHNSDINAFDKVKPYNLTHLNLMFIDRSDIFNDILAICVSVCPYLKSLFCPILQKQHLDLCSQLQELEKLQLYCFEETYLDLNNLVTINGKRLTSLKISNFCISVSVLSKNCPRLNLLEMDRVNLQHNVSEAVYVFHNLEKVAFKKFIFIEPVVSQAVTRLLASAPNLKQLCFENCELFSSDIKTQILRCCEQCKLKVIDFCDSEVDLALLRNILVTCSTLKNLYYDECTITPDYHSKTEIKTIVKSLPNKPRVGIAEKRSSFHD